MLRATYRAIIIGKAKSAENYIASSLSDRELSDIGYSRSTFISKSLESVIKDLDADDKLRAHKVIRPSSLWSMSGLWAAYMRKAGNSYWLVRQHRLLLHLIYNLSNALYFGDHSQIYRHRTIYFFGNWAFGNCIIGCLNFCHGWVSDT